MFITSAIKEVVIIHNRKQFLLKIHVLGSFKIKFTKNHQQSHQKPHIPAPPFSFLFFLFNFSGAILD